MRVPGTPSEGAGPLQRRQRTLTVTRTGLRAAQESGSAGPTGDSTPAGDTPGRQGDESGSSSSESEPDDSESDDEESEGDDAEAPAVPSPGTHDSAGEQDSQEPQSANAEPEEAADGQVSQEPQQDNGTPPNEAESVAENAATDADEGRADEQATSNEGPPAPITADQSEGGDGSPAEDGTDEGGAAEQLAPEQVTEPGGNDEGPLAEPTEPEPTSQSEVQPEADKAPDHADPPPRKKNRTVAPIDEWLAGLPKSEEPLDENPLQNLQQAFPDDWSPPTRDAQWKTDLGRLKGALSGFNRSSLKGVAIIGGIVKKGMAWRRSRKRMKGTYKTWGKNYSGMSYDTAHRCEVIHDFVEEYPVFYRASVSYTSLGKKIPALRAYFEENPEAAANWGKIN